MSPYAAGRLLLRAVCGVVLGLMIGLCAVALHPLWWGLLLGAVATLATVIALPAGPWRVAYAVGWVCVVVLAAVPRTSGSYAVAANLPGYLVLGLGMVVVVVAVGTLPFGRHAPGDEDPRGRRDIG